MPISQAARPAEAVAAGGLEVGADATRDRARRLALVLWSGDLGGAETVSAALAREWRRLGVEASIVFVTDGRPLSSLLDADGVPHLTVGFRRGRDALRHPRRLAAAVAGAGPDGALLVDAGQLAVALRVGGYRGRLVGVEHGKVLARGQLSRAVRAKDRTERALGRRFRFADVGVSDFIVEELRRLPHARRLRRIHNGVDTGVFAPGRTTSGKQGPVRLGCAARLVPGKGVDTLLEAVARLPRGAVRLQVAGDGPERAMLEAAARRLGLEDAVAFLGRVEEMPGFWRSCDVAVVPSDSFVESFSMSTLEAMACGVPVVATSIGGIPEVLAAGESGAIVPPGDAAALADALRRYVEDSSLRERHGAAGAARARATFSVESAAARYLELFA